MDGIRLMFTLLLVFTLCRRRYNRALREKNNGFLSGREGGLAFMMISEPGFPEELQLPKPTFEMKPYRFYYSSIPAENHISSEPNLLARGAC